VKRALCLLVCFFPLIEGRSLTLTNRAEETQVIRVALDADERVTRAAQELAARLEKMFGKPFPILKGEAGTGILLGTAENFPEFGDALKIKKPGDAEAYLIKTDNEKLFLVGASALGAQNAVWDFLYRLGYRHYFPGDKWEIIPKRESYECSFEVTTRPAFATREIFVGYGLAKQTAQDFQEWKKHNRLDYGFRLRTGHIYKRIIQRNQEAFAKHPEYLVPPLNLKFDVSNEGLRQLVVEDSVRELEKNPQVDSISMDPSDGGGWPESSPLGSVSNQAITLANTVAAAVQQAKPGTKVGIYAYNEHSPPPTIPVHPDVIVSVATEFIRSNLSFEELMASWAKQGATLGVRDYFAVFTWDRDLPGKSRASSPGRVGQAIQKFFDLGARYYVSETSYSSGPNGLGHYVAARCLWDPSENQRISEMREEFLAKAFGTAKEPMRQFYTLIDGTKKPLLSDDLLGRLCRALEDAYAKSEDEAVLARLDDLAAYVRFVELYRRYSDATGANRQAAFKVLAQFVKQIETLGVVTTRGMLRDIPIRDPSLQYENASLNTVATSPPKREDLRKWLRDGIEKYNLLTFEPVAFTNDLVPLKKQQEADVPGESTLRLRGTNNLFTYLEKAGDSIEFSVEGGQLYKGVGTVRIKVFPKAHPLGESICDLEVPADGQNHRISLKSDYEGLNRIEIKDGGSLTLVHWPLNQRLALPSGQEECVNLNGRYSLCFFVPKGTRRVSGYASHKAGRVLTGDGSEIVSFAGQDASGYFDIPVPAGLDDTFWKLDRSVGRVLLMTVPPYLSFGSHSMLTPREALTK